LTANTKVKVGFGVGFALLTVILIAALLRNLQWEESARRVVLAHETIELLQEIAFETQNADSSAGIFAVSHDQRDLERSVEALTRAKAREDELGKIVEGNAMERRMALEIRGLIDRRANSAARAAILELESEERDIIRDRTAFQDWMTGVSREFLLVSALGAALLIVVASWRISTDLEKRADAERALIAKEEQYRQVVELAGDIICRTDEEGRITFCNEAALNSLHFTRDEVIGRLYLKLIRQDKRRQIERFYLRQFGRKQKSTYLEFPLVDGHGVERWVGQNVQLVLDSGKITGYQAIVRDITERRRTELELKRSRNFIERIAATTPGMLYVYDLVDQRAIFTNREAISVLGYNPGQPLTEIPGSSRFHPDDQTMLKAHHEALRHAQDGEVRRVEYRARHADGRWVWLSGRETPFERGPDGLVKQIVGISQDITARKAAQDKLAYQANFDALTGLANRHYFWTRLQGVLRRASIEHSETAICLFDVDRFKEINDRHGHAAGDEVLEAIGNIVRAQLRSSDVSGRLGGDEFCFALPGTDDNEAARVAERIRERLSTLAFGMSAGSTFTVTATFGVARAEPDMDAKEILEAADRALYRAKSAGRNRVMVEA
jgi:diguanylate cyclase (GGDEF)-like protein/PAS domain S-box-containing protein